MTDRWEEKGGEVAGYLLVDVLELRLFYVELVSTNLCHCIVLDQENAVCLTVNAAQAETRIVGLKNHLARKVRHYAANHLGSLWKEFLD